MFKKFNEWIIDKIWADKKERNIVIKEREVYWCALGENIGDEENGKGDRFRRPVLILKKFNNNIFWGIPMSTQNKVNPYYIRVKLKGVEQSVMISQLRILDTKRLANKIGHLSQNDYGRVVDSIIAVLRKF